MMYATLDNQVRRMGFWSTIVFMVTVLASFLLPLDIPGGLSAEHADRVAWLNDNRSAFILGWINQMISMLSLSGIFLGMAWQAALRSPLSGIVGGIAILLSITAFIIPKFIAIWTIPQLAQSLSSGGIGSDFADQLLMLLNVSVPFSLYTSFDYLGFWLYALFALVITLPLFANSLSWKIAAVALGIFGIAFHSLLIALLMNRLAAADIEIGFLVSALFLIIAVVAALFGFRSHRT